MDEFLFPVLIVGLKGLRYRGKAPGLVNQKYKGIGRKTPPHASRGGGKVGQTLMRLIINLLPHSAILRVVGVVEHRCRRPAIGRDMISGDIHGVLGRNHGQEQSDTI